MQPFALGSGLYDLSATSDTASSPFALGSGLYGQQMPQPTYAAQARLAAPAPQAQSGADRFSNILSDPRFLLGVQLLGGARSRDPFTPALVNTMAMTGALTNQKLAQQRQQQQQQQFTQQQQQFTQQQALAREQLAQQGNIANRHAGIEEQQLAAQVPLWQAQAQRYTSQSGLENQQMELARRQFEQEQSLMQGLLGHMSLGQGLMSPQGGGNLQPQSFNGPSGKFGTPAAILDNLAQTESGGNPRAVNPQTGAQGTYQFLPSTAQMLAKQGMQFDPFDPTQSRDAADFYLQSLVKQHGDWPKAIAAYGGFKTKDPSQYLAKVMGQPAPQQQQQQAQSITQDPQQLADLGLIASFVKPQLGTAMMERAKMLKPENVSPGTVRIAPNGAMQRVPDVLGEARLGLDAQKTQADVAKTTQEVGANTQKQQQQLADLHAAASSTDNSLQRMGDAVDELLKMPGLSSLSGISGVVGAHKLTQGGRDAAAKLESLKSGVVLNTLSDLKRLSANGGSGLGQLSDREGQILQNYIANLQPGQSEEQLRKNLGQIRTFVDQARSTHQQQLREIPGALPQGSEQGAPQSNAGAISLDDYLKQKRSGAGAK